MQPTLPNMDLSSSTPPTSESYTTTAGPSQLENFDSSCTETITSDDTVNSHSSYNSAADGNGISYGSFIGEESGNNNSLLNSTTLEHTFPAETVSQLDSSLLSILNDMETTIPRNEAEKNKSTRIKSTSTVIDVPATNFSYSTPNNIVSKLNIKQENGSILFLQSESTETNTSQEEVDPKSQLANKTIFKTDNPNLSIIEINENSLRDQDESTSVLLIDTPSDEDDAEVSGQKKYGISVSPNPTISNQNDLENIAEKRRRKAESLINSSKQKLNIAIAEASAIESASSASVTNSLHPATKREIKIYDTLDEFEKNLPETVTVLDTPFGSKVYLVGTAHFSEDSQDDVSFVIRNVRPDIVVVELCPSRIPILKLDEEMLLEEASNFTVAKIRNIIQSHGYINGIFFILLLQMSAQIAKDLGMAPGGEFRRAFEEIHRLPGCVLHLGDRPIRVTLQRALKSLSLWQTIKLVWRLTSTDTISIEEVEECKKRDLLEKLMQEMAGEFPAFSEAFVKERDIFLCHSLQLAAIPQNGAAKHKPVKVVGVVGIGHANGIAEMWGHVDPLTIPAIMEIPPSSLSTRICKYTFKYGIIGITIFAAFKLLRPRLHRFY